MKFSWRRKVASKEVHDHSPSRPPARSTVWQAQPACCACGTLLGFDPEDELNAEGPGRHLCGNCNRSRNWDAIEEYERFEHH